MIFGWSFIKGFEKIKYVEIEEVNNG